MNPFHGIRCPAGKRSINSARYSSSRSLFLQIYKYSASQQQKAPGIYFRHQRHQLHHSPSYPHQLRKEFHSSRAWKMKEAIVKQNLNVDIIDSPIPTPKDDQVVIKVIVSGSNPKDWKRPEWSKLDHNSGDDIAGTVHSVGKNVIDFKPGDRVAAFHEMMAAGGSYAEYGVAKATATFHVPAQTTFEEASTLPLAAMTAAVGLFGRLAIPEPWAPDAPSVTAARTPLLVYGAATAVGAFAIQLARAAGVHPIIGVAGRGIPFAESLVDASKGDAIVDYRKGDDAVVVGIKEALRKAGVVELKLAYDAVSENGSHENIAAVLAESGAAVTHVLPWDKFARTKGFQYPAYIKPSLTSVGSVHNVAEDFGYVWFKFFTRLLETGRLKGHPYEVQPGGLAGLSAALKNLKAGKASAVKYVFRIADTEGAGKD